MIRNVIVLVPLVIVHLSAKGQSPNWNPDFNSDCVVGTADLLGLLSFFGLDYCDQLNVQAVDSIDTEGSVQANVIGYSGTALVVSQFIDLTISDSLDILMINDFDMSDDAFLDGWHEGMYYYSTGIAEIRIHLPTATEGRKLIITYADSSSPVDPLMSVAFYYNGSQIWTSLNDPPKRSSFQFIFALGGNYFISGW
jgi:hypothetical protein